MYLCSLLLQFKIHHCSGNVYVQEEGLSLATQSTYHLLVNVTDVEEGSSSEATVFIALREKASQPQLSDVEVTAAESLAVGSQVSSALSVTGNNTEVVFSILSGNVGETFQIEPRSGALSLLSSLDFETTALFLLKVEATDASGLSSSPASVTVVVTDVAESPVIARATTLYVYENSANGTAVGDPVEAMDPDEGDTLFFSLPEERGVGFFTIDALSGQLRVGPNASLDYESTLFHRRSVRVQVTDSTGLSTSTNVTVVLVDVNEPPFLLPNASESTGGPIELSVEENSAFGAPVGEPLSYFVSDPDVGASLTFAIDRCGHSLFYFFCSQRFLALHIHPLS